MEQALTQRNFAAGELSSKMRGRDDLPIYQSGAERMVNFLSDTAGPSRFRDGFQFVFGTRRYQPAWLWPFTFNDQDAYEMEFTTGYVRFYKDNGIVTLASYVLDYVSNANPAVLGGADSHGFSTGQEIIVNGIEGTTELNNRSFVVTVIDDTTFNISDNFGNLIDSTNYGVYVSGGTATPVFEVATPYNIADVPSLKIGQNADVLYICHHNYEPMKLTRLGDNNWTLATFSRSGNSGTDPCGPQITISAISQANPAVVSATAHGYTSGQQVIINAVVGMVELNNSTGGGFFTITVIDADNFSLNGVDSTGYTAYSSAGYSMDKAQLVGAVAFYQGRLIYGYSDTYPESIWGSQPLDSDGNPQYDYFNPGTGLPADSFKFTLSPISSKVDQIHSLVPSVQFLAICTLEGISSCNGGTAGTAISPETVDITPAVTFGCLQQITPIFLGISMLYIHKSGLVMYSFEYDIFFSAYNAMDKDLACEQWSQSSKGSGIIQMVFQVNRPTAIWYARNDGVLIGRTYMVKENVNGVHRHIIGGTDPSVLSVGVMPRQNAYDQLWIVSQRVINGNTVCFVEYQNDEVIFPEIDDYWTGDPVADSLTYQNDMSEAQKGYVYMDAALTYDGLQNGVTLELAESGAVDEYVQLLLHTASNLTDSSANNFTLSSVGTITYSTNPATFGLNSLELHSTSGGAYLTVPNSPVFNFGSGLWTIDFWFAFPDPGSDQTRYVYSQSSNSTNQFYIRIEQANPFFIVAAFMESGGAILLNQSVEFQLPFPSLFGNMYHLAVVYDKEIIYFFLDGVLLNQFTIGGITFPNFTSPVYIGANSLSPATQPTFYFQEYRVSVGVDRWTSSFNPPALPYGVTAGFVFRSAVDFFIASMVGQQIWEIPGEGAAGGQATIVQVLSSTEAVIVPSVPFTTNSL